MAALLGRIHNALTTASVPYSEDHISVLTEDSTVWGKDFSRIEDIVEFSGIASREVPPVGS